MTPFDNVLTARPEQMKKNIFCIGPTVPDGMFSMLRDGFRSLEPRWPISFHADYSTPGFYRQCKKADLVLICTNQGTNWRMIRDIAKTHSRWAVVDGSDYVDFRGIRVISPGDAPLIFKREYQPAVHGPMPNVVPLSFSVVSDWRKAKRTAKFLNFVFAGQMYGRRSAFLRSLRTALDDPHSVLSPGGLNGGQYWSLLDSAKIAISLRGAGWDCVRHWEILSRQNCLLMLEADPRIKMSDPPLVDGVHCAMFRRPSELVEKVRHYLAHEAERREVARQGRAFALEHHSTAARAKFVLRTCLSRLRAAQP